MYVQSFIIIFATAKTFFCYCAAVHCWCHYWLVAKKYKNDIKGFTQIIFTHIFWFTTHTHTHTQFSLPFEDDLWEYFSSIKSIFFIIYRDMTTYIFTIFFLYMYVTWWFSSLIGQFYMNAFRVWVGEKRKFCAIYGLEIM